MTYYQTLPKIRAAESVIREPPSPMQTIFEAPSDPGSDEASSNLGSNNIGDSASFDLNGCKQRYIHDAPPTKDAFTGKHRSE